MRRFLAFLFVLTTLGTTLAHAQTDDEQILVFRNTGEVNLFFVNELDSMIIADVMDETLAENVMTQFFYAKDTVLAVPVEQIDSVAFGSRNEIEYRQGVVIVDETHRGYIVGCDEEKLIYSPATPANILPKAGDVLFYNGRDEMFDLGFAVRVVNVKGTDVYYEIVELDQVFSKFFYAGQLSLASEEGDTRADYTKASIEINLPIDVNGFKIENTGELKIHGKIVGNVLTGYYNGETNIDLTLRSEMKINLEGSKKFNSPELTVPFGTILGIVPALKFNGFADFSGEWKISMEGERKFTFGWDWERKNGKLSGKAKNMNGEAGNKDFQATNTLGIYLTGEAFFGFRASFDLSVVNSWGINIGAKIGPCASGEFSAGAKQTLANSKNERDRLETWSKGEVTICGKGEMDAYEYHPEKIFFGKKVENLVFKLPSITFLEKSWDILPKPKAPKAVAAPKRTPKPVTPTVKPKPKVAVTIAVKDTAHLITPEPPKMGFQIVNKNDEVIDSVFVAPTPQSADSTVRAYAAEIEVEVENVEEIEEMKVVPVVKYGDEILRHVSIPIKQFGTIQPYNFYGGNGMEAVISGATALGEAKNDSTTFILGNFMPVTPKAPEFGLPNPIVKPYLGIKDLVGTWTDEEGTLTIEFIDATQARYTIDGELTDCTYKVDWPQLGSLTFQFNYHPVLSYIITNYSHDQMAIYNKKTKQRIVLFRK